MAGQLLARLQYLDLAAAGDKMKKNKIYVTTMYRWGDRESHSYVLYAGFSKHKAIKEGEDCKKDRGNKYMPEIVEFTPDDATIRKTIVDETKPRFGSELSDLLACPCGDIPNHLCIEEGSSCKWAWVSGSCCSEWSVEFRTHYFKFDDPKLMELAIEAWNNAKRTR
jgi:hypothetical protein